MATPERKPLLSVIVPAYNRADDLATLLASLERDLHRVEVIIVDDATPDPRAYDALKARYPGVRFVRQERNQGPAAARNRGAREASSGLLFFVDSDTAVSAGTIDAILEIYADHPEFVACAGTSHPRPLNAGLFPAYKALLEASWVADREARITTIGHIGSRAFTIRRETMLALGGFDETMPTADVEDYEFGYRLRAVHGPIPFSTRIRVHHRYDTLLKQGRLYFRRVILWWHLPGRERGADEVGSTRREALAAVACTLTTLSFVAAVAARAAPNPMLHMATTALTGLGAAAALHLSRNLLLLCWRTHGPGFATLAFYMHVFLSWFICAGATVAVVQSLIRHRTADSGPRGLLNHDPDVISAKVGNVVPAELMR